MIDFVQYAVIVHDTLQLRLNCNRSDRMKIWRMVNDQRQAYNFGVEVNLRSALRHGKVLSAYDTYAELARARQAGMIPADVPSILQRAGADAGRRSVKAWFETAKEYRRSAGYWADRLRLARRELVCTRELDHWRARAASNPSNPHAKREVGHWTQALKSNRVAMKRYRVKPSVRKNDLNDETAHCESRLSRAQQARDKHWAKGTDRLYRSRKAEERADANLPAVRFLDGALLFKNGTVRLPGGTVLRLRDRSWAVPDGKHWTGAVQIVDSTSKVTGRIGPKDRNYRLHVQLRADVPDPRDPVCEDEVLGVDAGVKAHIAVSDGRALNLPDTDGIEARAKELQRARSRCDHKSRKWRRLSREIKALHERRNGLNDNEEKHIAKEIASSEGIKAVGGEITNTKQMMKSAKGTASHPGTNVAQKTGLNQSLNKSRFGSIRKSTERACHKHGRHYVGVAAAYTSQICHRCRVKGDRESQSVFRCLNPGCGWIGNADTNAACNVKHLTWISLMEAQVEQAVGATVSKGSGRRDVCSSPPGGDPEALTKTCIAA